MHWWAQEQQKGWKTTENILWECYKNPSTNEEKSLSIQLPSSKNNPVLKSPTIKGSLHQCKYRGFTTQCKPQKQEDQNKIRQKHTNSLYSSGQIRQSTTCSIMIGKEEYREKQKNCSWSEEYNFIL